MYHDVRSSVVWWSFNVWSYLQNGHSKALGFLPWTLVFFHYLRALSLRLPLRRFVFFCKYHLKFYHLYSIVIRPANLSRFDGHPDPKKFNVAPHGFQRGTSDKEWDRSIVPGTFFHYIRSETQVHLLCILFLHLQTWRHKNAATRCWLVGVSTEHCRLFLRMNTKTFPSNFYAVGTSLLIPNAK